MNDPNQRPDLQAKLTDRHEHNGWSKTPQQQVQLERSRGSKFPEDGAPSPEPSCDERRRQRETSWRKEFAQLLETHPREAVQVTERWEKRLRMHGIPLPVRLKDSVDYASECHLRLLKYREAHHRSLAYAHEFLEEFGSDFHKIRAILDRHKTGCETFAKIESLHEDLMAEIAKVAPDKGRVRVYSRG